MSSGEYQYPVLKITRKQIEKHIFLCDKFDCSVELPEHLVVADEKDAEMMGAWYGTPHPRNKKPGIMYIGILPDGSSHS